MPGHFVSDGKNWTPAMIIPRGPSHDRMGVTPGDILLKDEKGKPISIPDPAAVAFIQEQEGPEAKALPASPYKQDPLTEMAKTAVDTSALQAQLAEMAKEIAALKKGDNKK